MSAFDLSYRALEPRPPAVLPAAGRQPVRHWSACTAAAALGGCTLAEAEKALTALLDHHLLAQAQDGQYRFHDLIRGYRDGPRRA